VGSNYLARIRLISSEIAIKLMAAKPRVEQESRQRRFTVCDNKSMPKCEQNSFQKSRASRRNTQRDVLAREARGVEIDDATNSFEFSSFARDLDALRLRMMSVSFCERVREVSRQIAGATEIVDEFGAEKISEADRTLNSICDAIASAVQLLPCHGAPARRSR